MSEYGYTTFITTGDMPGMLCRYLCKHHKLTPEQAKSIIEAEPYDATSKEARDQWLSRFIDRVKAL